MTICPISLLTKCVNLHVRSLSPLLHTFFCPSLPYFPSFTPVCYTRFCFNATYEFTPPPNLRPVILGSKLLADLFPFICFIYYGIFYILISAIFSEIQLGHKTGPRSVCNGSRRRPFNFSFINCLQITFQSPSRLSTAFS